VGPRQATWLRPARRMLPIGSSGSRLCPSMRSRTGRQSSSRNSTNGSLVPHPRRGCSPLTTGCPHEGLRTRPWRCTRRRLTVAWHQLESSAWRAATPWFFGGENVRSYPLRSEARVRVDCCRPAERGCAAAAVCQPAQAMDETDRRVASARHMRLQRDRTGPDPRSFARVSSTRRREVSTGGSFAGDARRLPAPWQLFFPGPSARCDHPRPSPCQ